MLGVFFILELLLKVAGQWRSFLGAPFLSRRERKRERERETDRDREQKIATERER